MARLSTGEKPRYPSAGLAGMWVSEIRARRRGRSGDCEAHASRLAKVRLAAVARRRR